MKRAISEDAGVLAGAVAAPAGEAAAAVRRPLRELMDDSLLDELLARSRDEAGGLRLTGEGSMLGDLVTDNLDKIITALESERHDDREPAADAS